jgi:hypothetical protein
MATVTGLTKERMEAIEDASVVSGEIVGGHLILTTFGGDDIDAGEVLGSVPDASTTVKGIVELATNAEAVAGSDTVRAVTPAAMQAALDALESTITSAISSAVAGALQAVFPVGSFYTSHSVSTDPATILGFGTWSAVTGKVLIGVDGTFTAGSTGGAQTHTIDTANLPPHTHDQGTLDTSTGGTHTHQVYRDFDGASGSARWTFHTSAGTGGGANTTGGTGDHDHVISGSTGNGPGSSTAINHMPPWHAAYIWRRTA